MINEFQTHRYTKQKPDNSLPFMQVIQK